MRIINIIIFIALTISAQPSWSQSKFQFQNKEFVEGALYYKGADTITFVRNSQQYDLGKPNLIFLQGSLPMPIIFEHDEENFQIVPLSNFGIAGLVDQFNVFVLSKPFTPLKCRIDELTDRNLYVPDLENSNCYDINYQIHNNLEYCSERISFFINSLVKNKGNTSHEIILIGHSQGATEAARVASINSNVTYVAALSTNPLGRYQDYILNNRLDFINGEIDTIEYNSAKRELYNEWKLICDNRGEVTCFGDLSSTTLSYSHSLIDDLLKTDANVFYGVGSHDASSYVLDLMPLAFIAKGKSEPSIHIYEGVEHNFFPVSEDGTVMYNQGRWHSVMMDVHQWINDGLRKSQNN